jgi:hypothetical protein
VTNRLPPAAALAFYLGLGTNRSYEAVAGKFGVSKQAVVKLANKERWQERLQVVEQQAQQSVERAAAESLEVMNERHLQTLRVIQRKSLEALKTMPLNTAMEAVRALDMALTKERLIRGEPSDRTAFSVETAIRQEFEQWMTTDEDYAMDQIDDEQADDAGDASDDDNNAQA